MTCSPHAIPYRTWRLRIFSDLFLPRHDAQFSQRGRRCFSSTQHLHTNDANDAVKSTTTDSTVDQNDAPQKYRPSDSLPRSPLFELAKTRQAGSRTPKPKRTKADDARLENNPWAMALATPMRHCVVTGTRLPKAFLTEMGLVRRLGGPKPPPMEANNPQRVRHDLWWMPVELLKDELEAIASSSPRGAPPATTTTTTIPPYRKPAVMRMLSRALAFEYVHISTKYQMDKMKPSRLVPAKWRGGAVKLGELDIKALFWRKDMFPFVLKYMRRHVVKRLKEAYRYEKIKKKGTIDQWRALHVAGSSVSELINGLRSIDGMEGMETGAVVIFELPDSDATDANPAVPFASSFPDYITLPQTKSAVPVHDLSTLLTASERDALRQSIPRFSEKGAFFFRPDGPKSVEAMLAVWELKGFLMHDIDFFSDDPFTLDDEEDDST